MDTVQQRAILVGVQSPNSNSNCLKIIENCGRVCYKSENKISEDSYKSFCQSLYSLNHWAVFEHGCFSFIVPKHEYVLLCCEPAFIGLYGVVVNKVWPCFEVCVNVSHLFQMINYESTSEVVNKLINSFPKEVLSLAGIEKGETFFDSSTISTECNTYYTVFITTFRSIADELFRHRKNALNMESSRYCNYNKDKFNNSIRTCEPHWLYQDVYSNREQLKISLNKYLKEAESNYIDLISKGMKPQDARAVLPLDYAVDCCVTASKKQWDYIIKLRSSSAAHPNIRLLMNKIKEVLV